MNNPEKNRKLGENVRCLREQGLTFSQISQELKQPLSTCYSAMRSLKLSKDYTENLKMVVKKRKRNYTRSLQSKTLWGGSCCSSSESDQLVEESPSLQTSSSFTAPSPTYATYGLTSTTNQLLHAVNKSIEAIPWHQQLDSNSKNEGEGKECHMTTDHSPSEFPVASFTDTESISFVPCRETNPGTNCFLDEAKCIASSAPFKNNDNTKVTVLEENAENTITQKLTWALEQLENSRKPDEIVQLMNVVASALSILNSLKFRDNSTP
ncbi:hypothetical protein X798_05081 [Onchocerca flexuosa]|uniref:Uncharacterized protein n=1 Tax=Onchocerca flexuosa TaxID=387005 RepID=A0A238BR49_9BILA|nr:hypothetical protein X798_05081 [Onchocerca flexuosa]